MRDDIFIIWGNGLNHLEEIIDIIRNDYKIHIITKHNINNMEKFIEDIYKCDTVPWNHLIAKTKYLIKSPKICYSVYITNENPKEKYYGKGDFRHIQCENIKKTKEKIRNLYNPKKPNGERTENHVIHATDYKEQTIYLKNLLKIKNKEDVQEKCNSKKNVTLEINSIHCNILGQGFIPVKLTPHYLYLNGNKEIYKNYIFKYLGVQLKQDHLPGAYDKLIKNFDINKIGNIIIKKHKDKYIVKDGVHRLSIMLYKNFKKVKVCLC